MPKTWTEKLNDPAPHTFKQYRGQYMLLPTARMVDAFMRKVRPGRHVDVKAMRAALAKKYGAEVTCPVTLGYHLRTVGEAAWEAYHLGFDLKDITPFWRVLDSSTPTAGRLACGLDFIAERRAAEDLPA